MIKLGNKTFLGKFRFRKNLIFNRLDFRGEKIFGFKRQKINTMQNNIVINEKKMLCRVINKIIYCKPVKKNKAMPIKFFHHITNSLRNHETK